MAHSVVAGSVEAGLGGSGSGSSTNSSPSAFSLPLDAAVPAVRSSVSRASPGQWALVYFGWLRDFFGCEVGPHPKTVEPRRNVRQVDHSDALLAFASLLVAWRKPWASGHGRVVCHQMERAVQELVHVRTRRLQTAAGTGA